MSIKKNALAVALVAGLAMAGAASAYTYLTDGDATPEYVATYDVTGSTYVYTMQEDIQVRIDPQDLIIGRTTGFQVRVTLQNGAVFNANPSNASIGAAITNGTVDTTDDWNVSLVAGGANTNYAVYTVTPPTTNPVPPVQDGFLFSIIGAELRGLTALRGTAPNNTVSANFFFADSNTAAELPGTNKTVAILQGARPSDAECDTNEGDVQKRIDVAGGETYGYTSKTRFSADGSLGGGDEPGNTTFDFGTITVDDSTTPVPSFNFQGTDEFTTVLNFAGGTNLSAFDAFYLDTDGVCDGAAGQVQGTVDGSTVTFEYTLDEIGGTGDGFSAAVCGYTDGETEIDDGTVSQTTTFQRGETLTDLLGTCSLLPLQYNGSVVRVYHVNPAGNSEAQSFIRVINPGVTNGRVTINAFDDQGNAAGPISFTLDAGKSVQLNSVDLESGNAGKGLTGSLGDGAGKWRLFVTGEFAGMVVQSLNRNMNDGTVTNLTDADTRGEQQLYDVFE